MGWEILVVTGCLRVGQGVYLSFYLSLPHGCQWRCVCFSASRDLARKLAGRAWHDAWLRRPWAYWLGGIGTAVEYGGGTGKRDRNCVWTGVLYVRRLHTYGATQLRGGRDALMPMLYYNLPMVTVRESVGTALLGLFYVKREAENNVVVLVHPRVPHVPGNVTVPGSYHMWCP